MTDFTSSLTPIVVPTLAGNTAAQIAAWQASLSANIVSTGNSLLNSYLQTKATDFFSVGDVPVAGFMVTGDQGTGAMAIAATRPTSPTVDYAKLDSVIDQLAALLAPTPPTLQVPLSDTPSLAATAPVITLPATPAPFNQPAPSGAPSIDAPVIPDAPLVVLPSVPTFDEFQLPAPPAFSLPTFSTAVPQNLLAPPTAQFSYVDPGYTSQLQQPLIAKLLNDLVNGSYGIDPNDETLLWFRARDRAAQQVRTGVVEAQRRAAATSFPMPQGAYYDAILQEEQKGQSILAEANRDIQLRRSELYVDGRKFTIQQVKEYERILIDLYNATQERALNYSKANVELGIAIYDASVRNYNASLEGYKAEASVFETKMRAELVKTEIFRAQIAAEQARVDFNRAKIEQYKATLSGIQMTVDLYKARLEAANVFMSVQKLRLEIFQSQVQVYSELVRAKEAEYNIYLAAVKGQMANVDIYKAQIDAYNATLAGVKTQAEIKLQANESLIQQYKNTSAQYVAQLQSFEKQLQARLDEAKTKGILYGADIDSYRAFTSTVLGAGQLYEDNSRQFLEAQKMNLNARIKQVEFRLQQLTQNVDLQKDINSHGVDFLRTALGGAISGVNSLGVQTT